MVEPGRGHGIGVRVRSEVPGTRNLMGSAPRQDGLELARRPTVVIGPTGPAHGEHWNGDIGWIEGRPTPQVRELLDEGPPFSAPLRAGARRQSLPSRVADQPTHEPLGRGLAVVDPPTLLVDQETRGAGRPPGQPRQRRLEDRHARDALTEASAGRQHDITAETVTEEVHRSTREVPVDHSHEVVDIRRQGERPRMTTRPAIAATVEPDDPRGVIDPSRQSHHAGGPIHRPVDDAHRRCLRGAGGRRPDLGVV